MCFFFIFWFFCCCFYQSSLVISQTSAWTKHLRGLSVSALRWKDISMRKQLVTVAQIPRDSFLLSFLFLSSGCVLFVKACTVNCVHQPCSPTSSSPSSACQGFCWVVLLAVDATASPWSADLLGSKKSHRVSPP